jgi:hypothetical protein
LVIDRFARLPERSHVRLEMMTPFDLNSLVRDESVDGELGATSPALRASSSRMV